MSTTPSDDRVSRTQALRAHPLAQVIRRFIGEMDDHLETIRVAVPAVAVQQSNDIKSTVEKLSEFRKDDSTGGPRYIAKDAHETQQLAALAREMARLRQSRAVSVVIRSLFIGTFSSYDAYLGDLLRTVYIRKQELFKRISREITLSELLEFEEIEQVKIDVLEREVETFLRASYTEQYEDLEKRFGFTTLRAFAEWPSFVEASQRRNLLVHADGRVSRQYIMACHRAGFEFDAPVKIGDKIGLDPAYLVNSLLLIRQVGFMLGHTIWRKLFPQESEAFQHALNDALYDKLLNKQWRYAREMGQFGLRDEVCKDISELDR
jgi:hypothetical protein